MDVQNEIMEFMKAAKEEACIAKACGEVPIGAVIVKDGVIIAKAHNMKETMKDCTAHAEILAIKKASEIIRDWRLTGCHMYVTLEPCPMCASAISQSRMSKVFIGTFNKEMGACGSIMNLLDKRGINSFTDVKWLYDEECADILCEFFEENRK